MKRPRSFRRRATRCRMAAPPDRLKVAESSRAFHHVSSLRDRSCAGDHAASFPDQEFARRAKKAPGTYGNPRGAEDSVCFRERLDDGTGLIAAISLRSLA